MVPPSPPLGTAHPVALIAVIYQCLTFLLSSMEHFTASKSFRRNTLYSSTVISSIISHKVLSFKRSEKLQFYRDFENMYWVPSLVFVRGQL
jgi:hypothetical protein